MQTYIHLCNAFCQNPRSDWFVCEYIQLRPNGLKAAIHIDTLLHAQHIQWLVSSN